MALSNGGKRSLSPEDQQFHSRWEEDYFCAEILGKTVCVICRKKLRPQVRTEFIVKRHYLTHAGEFNSLVGVRRTLRLSELKNGLLHDMDVSNITSSNVTVSDAALRTSYILSELIAKRGNPYTDGMFIKECITKAAEELCPEKVESLQTVSLSPNTITDRVTEMGNDIVRQLRYRCKGFEAYSLALIEIAEVTHLKQSAIFVRGVDEDMTITEEFLDMVPLQENKACADIFNAVEAVLKNVDLLWERLVSVATDGAPAICGDGKKDFIARMRQKLQQLKLPNSTFPVIHCMIQQEALGGKILHMRHVMNIVTYVINFILSEGRGHQQFRTLLEDMGMSEAEDAMYYSEVCRLSRGAVLSRVFALREEIVNFMSSKKKSVPELSHPEWLQDLAFLCDITDHLSALSKKMQGRNQIVTDMHKHIETFKCKLVRWENQIKNSRFDYFSSLKSLNSSPDAESLHKFTSILKSLRVDFEMRFRDLQRETSYFKVFLRPFSTPLSEAPQNVRTELEDMKCDTILSSCFGNRPLCEFSNYLTPSKYPTLRNVCAKYLAMFSSTNVCEQFSSKMNVVGNRYLFRLPDTHLMSVMRTMSSQSIYPDYTNLVLKKRAQVSTVSSVSSLNI